MNSNIIWRRNKVSELSSQGYNQSEISRILQISQPTINRDLAYLRQQAKTNIKKYIDERLPEEYEKCMIGLTAILKEAWNTANNTEDKREKIHALSLAKDCYSMKLDLLTNATVVDDAIRFVSNSHSKVTNSISDEENSKSDDGIKEYSLADGQQEQEQEQEDEQEEEMEENDTTMNQVF